jgi:hypothetical protein
MSQFRIAAFPDTAMQRFVPVDRKTPYLSDEQFNDYFAAIGTGPEK